MRCASTRLQKPIEWRCQDRSLSWPKPAPKPDLGAKAGKSLQENEAPQKQENPGKLIAAALSRLNCDFNLSKWSFRARLLSKTESPRCENEAFVWDVLQKLNVEDVKAKLSCEASLKNCRRLKMWKRSFRARRPLTTAGWRLKMWKWSFRARLPSQTEGWRCENEAFVRDFV